MIPDLTIKKSDAGKVISGQFKDADGVAVNCTGNTGRRILMRQQGSSALKINSTFTFTNATTGSWSYTLLSADVDTVGRYLLEFEVTFPTQTLTFPTNPDNPYIKVLIQSDLG